jgi:AraC-like DNA-binding protein
MQLWRVAHDPKLDTIVHTTSGGFGHSLLASLAAYAFSVLRVSASVWEHGEDWLPLHVEESVHLFELEYGVDGRAAHNARARAAVTRDRRTVVASFLGFTDFFVPIRVGDAIVGILVVGPVLLERPGAADLVAGWQRMTHRKGHPSDPAFMSYVSSVLSTLVLSKGRAKEFAELLECVAGLLAGSGDPATLANRANLLRAELEPLRYVDQIWGAVQSIVGDRSFRTWFTLNRSADLRRRGLTRTADHVAVGLTVDRSPRRDPVDHIVRCDAFQRAVVELARRSGDALAGRVGDSGVVFLCGAKGSDQRKRSKVQALVERATRLARVEFELGVYFGAARIPGSEPFSRSYQAALSAAANALGHGDKLTFFKSNAEADRPSLAQLRRKLSRVVEESPAELSAEFERYIATVLMHSGQQLEPTQMQLEVGFERAAEPLLETGTLEARSFEVLQSALQRRTAGSRRTEDVCAAYRTAVAALSAAVERPVTARRDRQLTTALEYIDAHYTEPLPLSRVARVAGFAPGHFSKLFARSQRISFADYVRARRLERARYLLDHTDLAAARIARLTGFSSAQYFSRAFGSAEGVTPLAYRKRKRRDVSGADVTRG